MDHSFGAPARGWSSIGPPLIRALGITVLLVAAVVALFALLGGPVPTDNSGPVAGWPAYGGDAGGTRYSPLTQITPDNVDELELAWTYHTGDVSTGSDSIPSRSSFQATPVLLNGTLYFSTPFSRVVALDPETGAERWTHDPGIDLSEQYSENLVSRGVATWTAPTEAERGQICGRRVLFGTLDARLLALDAGTGRPCLDFGESGQVDLKVGVGRVEPGEYQVTSPPVVVDDLVAVGSALGDNRRVEVERGTIRGFDVRTGELRWSWDPIPRSAADPGWEAWASAGGEEGARKTGAGNAWAPLSADSERDLIFIPTGSAAPDFYGGVRPGSDVFANSVVALRASTGKRVWHYQVVRHDLWDYDLASQPTLVDLDVGGQAVPAVVQPTKMGFLFLLDRETGEPLYPVEERTVPASDVPGEETWPTQRFPTHPAPLHDLTIDVEEDAWGILPGDREWCRKRMGELRYDGIFTPPALGGSLQYPSMTGGANWGGAAVDPTRGLLVLNMNRFASWVQLGPRDMEEEFRRGPGDFTGQEGTPYIMRREGVLTSPRGLPCTSPPFGVLTAVDLNSGSVRWRVPLGTPRDLLPFPVPWAPAWGVPNLGGPIITGSGLVFIGAAMERTFRAFDLTTGTELWSTRLPAPAMATPMTYRLREDGRQFVVVAAGGHAGAPDGIPLSDALVAYALPE